MREPDTDPSGDQRVVERYLAVLHQLEPALVVGGDLGEQRALSQQHKRQQAIERAESHHQV